MERGWFTQENQDKPKETIDFFSKVDCVPKSIIRETAVHFKENVGAEEILDSIGNTRKVVLSALYAEVLKRLDISSRRIEQLVRSTEASSIRRIDLVSKILQLSRVLSPFAALHLMPLISMQTGDKPPLTKTEKIDREVILCKDTLSQIRLDMKRTVLPSEISPVPREVGSPSAGKLTADQWRTFCTVHAVVTLVRLWGNEISDSRQAQILGNFLHLVAFTNLVHMRTLTRERITNIEQENLAYLRGLRKLYPSFSLVPKHHMALHLPEILRDFGPVHAWRTFAFERLNQIFQNIPTNCLLGVY